MISAVVLLLSLTHFNSAKLGTDLTLVKKSTGCDVTKATLDKLQSSGLFKKDDHFLMERVSFMSKFGNSSFVKDGAGIWQMTQKHFSQAVQLAKDSNLLGVIKSKLCLDFENESLEKPLVNALVALLLIEAMLYFLP